MARDNYEIIKESLCHFGKYELYIIQQIVSIIEVFLGSPTGRSGRQRIRGERKKERKEKKKAGYECTHICLSIRTFIVMYLAHRYALRKTRREETLVTLLAREKQIRDQGRRDRLVRPPTEPRRDYTTVRDGEREKKRRRKNEKERGTWAEFRQNAA